MITKKYFVKKILGIFNCIALVLVALSANITCVWVFHQPDFPEAANKFKKIK